jgi:hypothetical protein
MIMSLLKESNISFVLTKQSGSGRSAAKQMSNYVKTCTDDKTYTYIAPSLRYEDNFYSSAHSIMGK